MIGDWYLFLFFYPSFFTSLIHCILQSQKQVGKKCSVCSIETPEPKMPVSRKGPAEKSNILLQRRGQGNREKAATSPKWKKSWDWRLTRRYFCGAPLTPSKNVCLPAPIPYVKCKAMNVTERYVWGSGSLLLKSQWAGQVGGKEILLWRREQNKLYLESRTPAWARL